jgi:hypothetical protein
MSALDGVDARALDEIATGLTDIRCKATANARVLLF